MKWEYLVIEEQDYWYPERSGSFSEATCVTKILNKYGELGWEAVTVTYEAGTTCDVVEVKAVMKRVLD